MEARLTQHTPLSVWSSSKSILDKLVQVQHTEGPWLLIVNNCALPSKNSVRESSFTWYKCERQLAWYLLKWQNQETFHCDPWLKINRILSNW
jgi:hypothetical protein